MDNLCTRNASEAFQRSQESRKTRRRHPRFFQLLKIQKFEHLQTTPLSTEQIAEISSIHLKENEKLIELGNREVIENIKMTWIPRDSDEKSMKEKLEEMGQMRRFSIDLVPKILVSKGNMVRKI